MKSNSETPDILKLVFTDAAFNIVDLTRDQSLSYDELKKYAVNYFLNGAGSGLWLQQSGLAPGWDKSVINLPSLYERALHIKIPVLMLQGEDDWNTPTPWVYEFESAAKRLKLKNFTFKYYSGVGHAPSAEMLADALEFFNSHQRMR